jgi:hypothetical protein
MITRPKSKKPAQRKSAQVKTEADAWERFKSAVQMMQKPRKQASAKARKAKKSSRKAKPAKSRK